jgi:hypothetical protein
VRFNVAKIPWVVYSLFGSRYLNSVTLVTLSPLVNSHHGGVGRRCGVGRGLGVTLGVAVGVGLAVGVAVGLGLEVGVGVTVAVGVGVGVGGGPDCAQYLPPVLVPA